ncbi:MAG: efflux RND transporter periplasmic adaptor subunit [Gammaproteobacteria bacterium]|nr:MAG: efflux RND transporter periplasmic adaptor subunit [Gammaproteobacteria bacterium]
MPERSTTSDKDILHKLGINKQDSHKSVWMGLSILMVIIAISGFLLLQCQQTGDNGLQFVSQQAQRGDLTVTVTATGTLQPTNLVDVGLEVSGTITHVYVDYNDQVTSGQILARLDTAQLEARFRQAQAALDLARATVKEAEANLQEASAHAIRYQELRKKGLCSIQDCDAAQTALLRAEAGLDRARAQVIQAQAQLDTDRTALDKAILRSPINGIVLKRHIERGQTVAASLQTPILFTLAESLSQMELHVNVDEADIGLVREGQSASFTVDAYPDISFPAQITQVRFGAQEIEGVSTYETLLAVDNPQLLLRPGMTATADILVQEIHDTLLVPNAALRFSPPLEHKTESTKSSGILGSLFPRRPSRSQQERITIGKSKQQQVWVLRNNEPYAIPVTVGPSDGVMTQIFSGEVEPGMALLIETMNRKN